MPDLLKPEGYADRIVDRQLERLLQLFGAVEVAGTMWCGKTWTSLAHAASVTRIGLAGPRSAASSMSGRMSPPSGMRRGRLSTPLTTSQGRSYSQGRRNQTKIKCTTAARAG